MYKFFLILLLTCLSFSLKANNSSDSEHQFLLDIEKEASKYYDDGFYSKSAELYAKALDYCKNSKDTLCEKIWIGKIASDLFSGEIIAIEKYIGYAEIFFKEYPVLHRRLKFYQAKATYEHYNANYDKALKTFDYALSISKTNDNNNKLVKSNLLNSRGNLYVELNQFKKAYLDYRSSLDLMLSMEGDYDEHIATSYNNVGVVHHYMGEYDSATYYYNIAKDKYIAKYGMNHPHVARQLYNIGQVYLIKGYYDESLVNLNKALEIRIATHGENHEEVAKLYGALGQIYEDKKDYDLALLNFKKQNIISKNVYGENHPYIGESLNDIAVILLVQKKYEEAKEYFLSAYNLRKLHYTENHLDVSRSAFALAEYYLEVKNPKEALFWANKNKNIIQKVQGNSESLIMQGALELVGDVEFVLGNRLGAQKNYEKALLLYEKNFHPSHWKLSQIYVKLGKIEGENDFEKGKVYFDKAVILSQNINYDAAQNSNKIINPKYIDALFERAKFYKENAKLKEALSDIKKVVFLLPQIRKNFLLDNSKLLLSERYKEVVDIGVEICWSLYKQTAKVEYINQAHLFIESSKQNVLFEDIHRYSSMEVAGLPRELIAEEKKIKADLSFLIQETLESEVENAEIVQKIKQSEREWLVFTNKIKTQYPEYYNLKYNEEPPSLALLSSQLKSEQSLIQYFISDNHIFAIVVNKNTSHFFRFENAIQVRKAIEKLTLNMNKLKATDYLEGAFFIYNEIFAPFEKLLSQDLVIIPDDFLYALSFESLVSNTGINKYKQSFLINKYNIQYAYSASLFIHKSNKENRLRNLLAILPHHDSKVFSASSVFSTLPGAVKEIRFLKKYFKVKVLEGDDASVSNLVKFMSDYDILHLATHAHLDSNGFANSYFQLQEDKFYTHQLYQMQIKASLAVLSACNTGIGKISKGEGYLSLARGFSYAGCDNIIMSLWSIPDKASSVIMQQFYKNLSLKQGKSEALRNAKLAYIESNMGQASMPFYWAGIVLQGNNEELILSSKNIFLKNSLLLGMLILAILFLLFLYKKKYF